MTKTFHTMNVTSRVESLEANLNICIKLNFFYNFTFMNVHKNQTMGVSFNRVLTKVKVIEFLNYCNKIYTVLVVTIRVRKTFQAFI